MNHVFPLSNHGLFTRKQPFVQQSLVFRLTVLDLYDPDNIPDVVGSLLLVVITTRTGEHTGLL